SFVYDKSTFPSPLSPTPFFRKKFPLRPPPLTIPESSMNSSRPSLRPLGLFAAIVLVPALAQAHPGHDHSGFGGGIVHPFQGLDHLLAMVAIGLWAAQLGGPARWMVPLSFVGTLTLGAVAGLAGLHLPGAEVGV